ncbi:MAG: TonB-dependent receptor [Candidatus Omnitrophota bacterium]
MNRLSITVAVLLIAIPVASALAVTAPPFQKAELVLFEEIPVVYSPAKKAQPISESPASTYVLTNEDIRMYPSATLYDSLRQVPGVNVMASTIAQPDIAIRGFNEVLSNQTLLLMDGRNLYLPAQGFFLWNTITMQPDEVKQVEVVKGPVASLYGANAFNGLINIIPKSPEEINGTYFSEKTNFHDIYTVASLVHGQRIDDLGYKVSLGWDRYDFFYKNSYKNNIGKADGKVEYYIDDDSKISLSGGGVVGQHGFLTSTSDIFLGDNEMDYLYMMLDCDIDGFEWKTFWNHFLAEYTPPVQTFKSKIDTVESEVSYNFDLFDTHEVTIGTGIRYDYAKASIWGPAVSVKDQFLWNGYVQDDWEVFDRFRVVGSGRMDYHTLAGLNLTGRVSGLFTIFEDNLLRASIGNSFRAPTLSEYFLDIYQRSAPMTHSFGQKDLSEEQIVTGEVGYEGKYFDRKLSIRSDFFVSYIRNFIDSTRTGFESLFPVIIVRSGYLNQGNATTWGVETTVEYRLTDWFRGFFNNTHQVVNYDENAFIRFTPKNMWNLGFTVDYEDWLEASLYWHHVSSGENVGNTTTNIDRYSTLNGRLGYWFTENILIAVNCQNMFLDKHVESPGYGEEIGRRIFAEVRLKF